MFSIPLVSITMNRLSYYNKRVFFDNFVITVHYIIYDDKIVPHPHTRANIVFSIR